ncbi:hypothetical protein [Thermogymnomonas acidicola]|uniref:hypothetical protein n=1 Tax=Thermogymnomonas acidicola TaxID=399579 RepID=UPI0014946DCB|nr:hypothetical protein [Thermogymnomonas acidicola]
MIFFFTVRDTRGGSTSMAVMYPGRTWKELGGKRSPAYMISLPPDSMKKAWWPTVWPPGMDSLIPPPRFDDPSITETLLTDARWLR